MSASFPVWHGTTPAEHQSGENLVARANRTS